ncbi:MAG TPA: lipid-A-disaccharide synthase N-terminal domain-containing protein [Alphaproteobacteria bacterium]|nr:lipid-A-disaccharide synthase N-terminal domain-containing protein [Alphaproteobacteria bacterium]
MQEIGTWLQANLGPWDLFGLFGQSMFMARFIYQWIQSERAKKVVVPELFWYLSVIGGSFVLIYAIHLHKIVFILSQAALPIYMRNIWFIWRGKRVPHA